MTIGDKERMRNGKKMRKKRILIIALGFVIRFGVNDWRNDRANCDGVTPNHCLLVSAKNHKVPHIRSLQVMEDKHLRVMA